MEFVKINEGYSMFQRFLVRLDNGTVAEIVPTTGDHIHFDANSNVLMGGDFPGRRMFVHKGIQYGVSIHFGRASDGFRLIGQHYEPTITRVTGNGKVSDSARQAIKVEVQRIIDAFVAAHGETLVIARIKHAERELERLNQIRAELVKKLIELDANIAAATREISQGVR